MKKLKFAFTNETCLVNDVLCHRIVSLDDFEVKAREELNLDEDNFVHKGELGGFLERMDNLSQTGNAWVEGNACIMGNAVVYGNGFVNNFAVVAGNAQVRDNAIVGGEAFVTDYAIIQDNAHINDAGTVLGNAIIKDNAYITDKTMIFGNARISGNAKIKDKARVSGYAEIKDDAVVYDNASVTGHAEISGFATISGNSMIFDKAKIKDDAHTYGDAKVYGEAVVCDKAAVGGNAEVFDYAKITSSVILSKGIVGKYAKIDRDLSINTDYVYKMEKPFVARKEKRYPKYSKEVKIKDDWDKTVYVTLTYGLEENNGKPYFFSRIEAPNAHFNNTDNFKEKLFPDMKDLFALNLCNEKGVPFYEKTNPWFYITEKGLDNPACGGRANLLANYIRIPMEESKSIINSYDNGELSKEKFDKYIDRQYPRWEKEASAVIEKYNLINREITTSLKPKNNTNSKGKSDLQERPSNER